MKKIGILLVILLLVGTSILLYLIYLNMNRQELTLPGTVIDEELLKEDIKLISSKDLRVGSSKFREMENEGENDYHSVYTSFRIKSSKNNYVYPYNVREAIRIWLYLEEREPIVEVHEVQVIVFQNFLGGGTRRIIITKEEFHELLEQVEHESYSTEELIEELTFMYIEQYNYPRWWEINRN